MNMSAFLGSAHAVRAYETSGRTRTVSARVQLPAALREYAAGAADLEVDAGDVDGVLAELARRFPRLRRHLFNDAGAVRDFVRVYLNDDDVRALHEGGATRVQAGDVIVIVPSRSSSNTGRPFTSS